MLKQLISELANDAITISQALTRAKLIASGDETFKSWINSELLGYDDVKLLPVYRIMNCKPIATFTERNKKPQTVPMDTNEMDDEEREVVCKAKITRSIADVEDFYKTHKSQTIILPETFDGSEEAKEFFRSGQYMDEEAILTISKEVHGQDFKKIVDITKQKLLDTLLALHEKFPDLVDPFQLTKEDKASVHKTVTTIVYGGHSPIAVAIDGDVTQNVTTKALSNKEVEQLKSYGVQSAEVEELKEIVKTSSGDKSTFIDKTMKWLGSVTASIAGRGLYEHIPDLTAFVHRLIA